MAYSDAAAAAKSATTKGGQAPTRGVAWAYVGLNFRTHRITRKPSQRNCKRATALLVENGF